MKDIADNMESETYTLREKHLISNGQKLEENKKKIQETDAMFK